MRSAVKQASRQKSLGFPVMVSSQLNLIPIDSVLHSQWLDGLTKATVIRGRRFLKFGYLNKIHINTTNLVCSRYVPYFYNNLLKPITILIQMYTLASLVIRY